MAKEVHRKGTKPSKNVPLVDLAGERFGRLVVIEQAEPHKGRIAWLCQCDCGNQKIATTAVLRKGLTKSCGCLRKEISKNKATKHLMCNTKLYDCYNNIKKRCYDKNCDHYKWYGAEGKGLCIEWLGEHGFEHFSEWAFENGYKEGLQIDRIDNSKGYSPDNCRWATRKINCRNKRNNHVATINGETKTLAEWCEIYNIDEHIVRSRITKLHWDEVRAITTPKLRNIGGYNDGNN